MNDAPFSSSPDRRQETEDRKQENGHRLEIRCLLPSVSCLLSPCPLLRLGDQDEVAPVSALIHCGGELLVGQRGALDKVGQQLLGVRLYRRERRAEHVGV